MVSPQPQRQTQDLSHQYNGDIGFAPGSADLIRERFARSRAMVEILVDERVLEAFNRYEFRAKGKKARFRFWGVVSLVAAGVGLASAAVELIARAFDAPARIADRLSGWGAILALFGLALALVLTHSFRLRQQWLDNRFAAERLRQWHFETLLDSELTKLASNNLAEFKRIRAERFMNFFGSLKQISGARVRWTRDDEPVFSHPVTAMTDDHPLRAEVWEAFEWLRLNHQANHWAVKIAPDERLANADRNIQGIAQTCFQVAVMILALQSLVFLLSTFAALPVSWHSWLAPVGAGLTGIQMLLLVVSVIFKKANEGLGFGSENEHYQKMAMIYIGINARAKVAKSNESRFAIMRDVEIWAQSELRDFLKIHQRADFVF